MISALIGIGRVMEIKVTPNLFFQNAKKNTITRGLTEMG